MSLPCAIGTRTATAELRRRWTRPASGPGPTVQRPAVQVVGRHPAERERRAVAPPNQDRPARRRLAAAGCPPRRCCPERDHAIGGRVPRLVGVRLDRHRHAVQRAEPRPGRGTRSARPPFSASSPDTRPARGSGDRLDPGRSRHPRDNCPRRSPAIRVAASAARDPRRFQRTPLRAPRRIDLTGTPCLLELRSDTEQHVLAAGPGDDLHERGLRHRVEVRVLADLHWWVPQSHGRGARRISPARTSDRIVSKMSSSATFGSSSRTAKMCGNSSSPAAR